MTDTPDPKVRTPSGHVITEIAVSTERTIRLREFENHKVFVSAKALIIQGLGEPDTVQAALLAQVNGWADAEEARVRGAPTASHPPLSAIATALPPSELPNPQRAEPVVSAPASPGPGPTAGISTRGNDPGGAGLRADGIGGVVSGDGERASPTGPIPSRQGPPPQSSAGPQPARDAPRGASPPGNCPIHRKPFRVPRVGKPYCATPTKKQGDKVVEWCKEVPRDG